MVQMWVFFSSGQITERDPVHVYMYARNSN